MKVTKQITVELNNQDVEELSNLLEALRVLLENKNYPYCLDTLMGIRIEDLKRYLKRFQDNLT